MKQTGLATDIQHFSLHDGPGIRTTVFFKGCPLRCRWCHNPEAISYSKDLMFYSQFCSLCGKCVELCPQGCFSIEAERLIINREKCSNCGECVSACNSDALELKGSALSIDEIVSECLIDRDFYKKEGGVTLSGGEPLMQDDIIFELMDRLKDEKIHLVLDTCGFVSYKKLQKSLKWVDLYYFDLKCISRDKHIEWAGADNTIIIENLTKLLKTEARIVARIPVIPGFNADENEINQIVNFLQPYKDKITAHLLPYHNLGSNKYSSLGQPYIMGSAKSPSKDEMERYKKLFVEAEIKTILFSN